MKFYSKVITCCADCPNCNWDVCYEKGKKVGDINKLPDWCPLPDMIG